MGGEGKGGKRRGGEGRGVEERGGVRREGERKGRGRSEERSIGGGEREGRKEGEEEERGKKGRRREERDGENEEGNAAQYFTHFSIYIHTSLCITAQYGNGVYWDTSILQLYAQDFHANYYMRQ